MYTSATYKRLSAFFHGEHDSIYCGTTLAAHTLKHKTRAKVTNFFKDIGHNNHSHGVLWLFNLSLLINKM